MGESSDSFFKTAQRLSSSDPELAAGSLQGLAELGLPPELFDGLLQQLTELLPPLGQVDQCLQDLLRFLQASRSPQAWLALFEREPDALRTLLKIFSSSRTMSHWLIADAEAFDLLRLTDGQPVARGVLQDEMLAQVQATSDARGAMRVLREYRQRETLRIAYGELLGGHSVDVVAGQLSDLAESILQAAVVSARRDVDTRMTTPLNADGLPLEVCVLALGRLGGRELDYDGQLDVVLIHQTGPTIRPAPSGSIARAGGGGSNPAARIVEYFQRFGQSLVRLLSEATEHASAYTIDMRLRPMGEHGPLISSVQQTHDYYETSGRTWERQAFIKARPVAGAIALGDALLAELQSWIYPRYLMRADSTGLAALKRRIERLTSKSSDGQETLVVQQVQDGLRNIEELTQFLQLLHGGDEASVRATNTMAAVQQLRRAGCLTGDEANLLEESYRWLRRIQHAAQLAREGMWDDPLLDQLAQFQIQQRKLSAHLLQQALADDGLMAAESDLILDPQPLSEVIERTLKPYGFSDVPSAYRRLQSMAAESIPFLSTRRCRHFLAAIAPQLLAAIATTPSPDGTLSALADVADSMGGKAGLWELFNAYPATLKLCVRLCACSPYLTSILTSNPGMFDELMDSLMLECLPTHEELSEELAELCRGAADIGPILQSFKNSMHLRVGMRDLLGKTTIAQTHQALADIADVCLEQVIGYEFHRLVQQLGLPTRECPAVNQPAAEMVVLAVGKLGGREPNYHSDIDVIFLFDVEGQTRSLVPNRRFEATSNRHFFNQLCQRIIHTITTNAGSGRLFDMDVHWRPLGRNGELAITIDDLQRYFADGGGDVSERQALCKARPIWGSPKIQLEAMRCVHTLLCSKATPSQTSSDCSQQSNEMLAAQMLENRLQLQRGSGPLNLKRGVGGSLDVEFIVQLLQMIHAHRLPSILVPGTLEASQQLAKENLLDTTIARQLQDDYEFLRKVESGIRLMNMSARHELPSDEFALSRLAYLLRREHADGSTPAETLRRDCEQTCERVRAAFLRVFEQHLAFIT
ncbi:MAG: hypothetical protein ABI557_03045 [Aureliella sp.]